MTQRFRLALVNAAEDVPRVIRAYGRACGGEFALVLRPTESRGVLVHLGKDGAHAWRSADGRDAPSLPDISTTSEDAVTEVKVAQKALGRQGPITLRGQWSGYLHCDGGVPVVELRRKLATYAVLTIASRPTDGVWAWKVDRLERWFGGPGQDTGEAPSLMLAIEAGLASAMGLLGQVCSQRDSRRRGAYDTDWAEKHPVRPAKERQDPTQRLKPRKRRRKTSKAAEAGDTSAASSSTATKARSTAKTAERPGTASKSRAEAGSSVEKRGSKAGDSGSTAPSSGKSTSSKVKPRTTRSRPKTTATTKATSSTTSRTTRSRTKAPTKAPAPLDDAAADQALLSAFKDAVSSALSEVS